MGRLKALKPRLTSLPRTILKPVTTGNSGAVDRSAHSPWRSLYGTARWQKKRRAIYARDGYTCQKTGEILFGKYPAPNSPCADHIIPAHVFWFDGRQHLFWDDDNIQTLSLKYHVNEKQKQEQDGMY